MSNAARIMRSWCLLEQVRAKATQPNVSIFSLVSGRAVRPHRALQPREDRTYTADLIIGADGEHSSLRSIFLDRPYLPQHTDKLVYRLSIDLEKVRADSDLRMLVLEPSTVTLWLGPSTHIMAYDLGHRGTLEAVLTCLDPEVGRTQFGSRKANIHELRNI